MKKGKRKNYFPATLIVLSFAAVFAAAYFLTEPKIIDFDASLSQSFQDLRSKTIELLLVGDIMLNRGVEYAIKTEGGGDFKFPFFKIAGELKKADIVFGNMEGPISDKGDKVGSIYSFRNDPESINGLVSAGFNILSVANNHAMDYGRQALEDTLLRLKKAGIDYMGGGMNATGFGTPVIKEVKGTKFAFLAYTDLCPPSWKPGPENSGINCITDSDLEKVKSDVTDAKKFSDIIIVSLHSGTEYSQVITSFQKNFSYSAIDAGADLVIGHHPHVVQKYEQYNSKWIFYSLGNFVFDQNFSEETMQGLMVKAIVKDKKISEVIPMNISINSSFQPETADKLAEVRPPLISFSASTPEQGDTLLIKMPATASQKEISGQFDSTKINFAEIGKNVFGIIGIDAKKKPGTYKLIIDFPDNYRIEKQIETAKRNFPVTLLAFTPELEEEGYTATSVTETIAKNDGPKLYETLATSSETPYFSKSFIYPLDKIVDVGAFGNIRKSGNISLQHLGVDLNADMNTPVYAVNDGVVKGTLELIDYGNTIVIDHGLGIFSLYLHMEKFNVEAGQKVARGKIIGLSGNTGYSIAPHLHFSIKANGASVDPLRFVATTQKEIR